MTELPRVDTSRVDPKYLKLLKDGQLLPLLAKWRAENPGKYPNMNRAYLSGADLSGADLSSVDLTDADLNGANLKGANLSETDLIDASLLEADLSGANLKSARLTGAMIARANLRGADLSDANLDNACLEDAQLGDANLQGASFTGATLTGAAMERASLRGANLNGARMIRADLSGADLTDASLIDATLHSARLPAAILRGAPLWHADLTKATLNGADLTDAELTECNLWQADFSNASLVGAVMMHAIAVGADFTGADLTGAHVYGISAWDMKLEGAIQSKLVITKTEPFIQVDDLEVAQFMYLLLNRRKLRDVLMTLGEKAVLILGRFTERKAFLDAIADKLRELGYLPIIFDFERPTDRDITETVKILAGLSLFVIADVTNPRSVPLELQATVPDYMVPFVTILQRGQSVFGMFDDLPNKYDWALPLLEYNTADSLLSAFERKVVSPALEKVEDIRRRKALPPKRRSAED